MGKNKKLTCVIDRLEDNKAVLKFDDGQKLTIPLDILPEESVEGSVLEIILGGGNHRAEEERAKQAKALLNQILKKA